ncbi:hypothetical protein BDP55DRAFT_565437 [Colletotrichum godetiae]|uniref:Zn(2)-C6 fungal-type domain-containing protein n=1 Tax=Colletotrichum godetiae TaxID=1209918 RepID=A0AAJ0EN93_9PEZI|nr:uncharacterized protein BDP55DRAFT_565437 [Colletotrichum godetiae]KAK1658336.1 hypothetical protein BDP55DRAFT_565437 [Colletotrichum godetiae]
MTKRSCDGCRRRKVKCDAQSPQCSNCLMSSMTCEYTVPAKKRGPPFRVHRTDQIRTRDKDNQLNRVVSVSEHSQAAGSQVEDSSVDSPPKENLPLGCSHPQKNCIHAPFDAAIGDLLSALGKALPYVPLEDVLSSCIDLYLQWEFPTSPIICEPMVRQMMYGVVPILRRETSLFSDLTTSPTTSDIPTIRAFALITALCAVVSSTLPAEIFPGGAALAMPFLRTSREALRLYQDYDIEHPESGSIIIRYFHSNSLHALGKTSVSWHAMGEALRLVQEMRLYDEASFSGLEWPEAQLRRNTFWHLYIGDKSASILNKVPISLHQMCLDTPITTLFDKTEDCKLLQAGPEIDDTADFECRLRLCFNLCFQLWYTASEMLVDLNLLSRLHCKTGSIPSGTSNDASELKKSTTQSYFDFTSILHSCPAWVRDPKDAVSGTISESTAQFRVRAIFIQKANLFVTFHMLRLVLLTRFSERGFIEVLGLIDDPVMLAMRKVEIASDLLEAVSDIPFEALQANGEPCVEKLRQVGVALLEIIHNVGNEAISTRARSLFGTLLDILARLNSRISDELSNDRES